ncbi:hypothetical protein E0485_05875 [Paenibacillus albiflavus]|uniref:Uncharacterized protein n=1 Tax=Paenibacillus albiflavus TaxID=2545760 RepID=A0A4R4EHQ0_9BACL|nr:hypothetical protein [Paenibacillus albiflavus]TCZ79389.1 hypothetical protein E0485_05875 [Paenibacillus albiflavus]
MHQLASIEGKNINIIKDLKPEDVMTLEKHTKIVSIFIKNISRIKIANDSFVAYENLIKKFMSKEITYHDLSKNIHTYILNYLAAFRAFLDHWDTHLKRSYGEESVSYQKFKEGTAVEFDAYFSYRFIYELRNYTLHLDMPLSSLTGKIDDNDNISVEIMVNRDKLLNTYKWPKKVKLIDMPVEFDINIHILQSFECLKRIQNIALNLGDINKVYNSAIYLDNIKIANTGNCSFGLVEHDGQTKETYKPQKIIPLPIMEASEILKMIQ